MKRKLGVARGGSAGLVPPYYPPVREVGGHEIHIGAGCGLAVEAEGG